MMLRMENVIQELEADIAKSKPSMVFVSPDLFDALSERRRIDKWQKLDGTIPIEKGWLEDNEDYRLCYPNRRESP